MKKKGEKLTKNNNKEKTQRKQKGFRLTSETLIKSKKEKTLQQQEGLPTMSVDLNDKMNKPKVEFYNLNISLLP